MYLLLTPQATVLGTCPLQTCLIFFSLTFYLVLVLVDRVAC